MGQIEVERDERGVLTLWLNNPGRLNALSNAMVASLCAEFSAAALDDALRVIVLRGRRGVFCAGRDLHDLRALQEASPPEIARMYDLMEEMNASIYQCRLPVVAAVEGHALGIATMIVSWTDIAIAADNASFGYPEIRHGIVAYGAVPTMLRSMPHKSVMDLLLSGRRIDSAEAVRLGILSEMVDTDSIDRRLEETLVDLLAGGRAAQIEIKRFARQCEALDTDAAIAMATRHAKSATGGACVAHGISAFLKREF